jgi:hypothetical protein
MTSRAREIRCRIGQKGDLEPKLEKRVLKTRFLTLDPPSLIRGGGYLCGAWGVSTKRALLPIVGPVGLPQFSWGVRTGLGTMAVALAACRMSTLWSFTLHGYSDCLVVHGCPCVSWWLLLEPSRDGASAAYWRQVVSSSC